MIYIMADILKTMRKEVGLSFFNNISGNEALAFFVNDISSNPIAKQKEMDACFRIRMIKFELALIDRKCLIYLKRIWYSIIKPLFAGVSIILKYIIVVPIGHLLMNVFSKYDNTSLNSNKSEGENVLKNNDEKLDIILAQWQTCVEMANSISQRRDSMNNIFVTLNLAIVATVSITWDFKTIFILIAGIIVCIIWLLFLHNYKLLNSEKFNVINSVEKMLPVQPFNDEWEKLKNNKKYKDSTKLEKTLPIMFIILYTVAFITIIIIKVLQ